MLFVLELRIDKILKTIDNKNIAIVGNQTSVVNQVHLVDTLISLNQKLYQFFLQNMGLEVLRSGLKLTMK